MTHSPRTQDWWDRYFLDLAVATARASKDPSTQVGAVIVRPDRTIASLGYNGFPRGIVDSVERLNDRPTKYSMIVHAESNAILSAREPVGGYTLYCTLFPCSDCAKLIIQANISRVVSSVISLDRWQASHDLASRMFDEAGIKWEVIHHD